MKNYIILLVGCLIAGFSANAQITKESKSSRGYLKLGLSNIGKELTGDLSELSLDAANGVSGEASMLENALSGRYGAKQGYAFEFGRNYYFHKNSLLPIFDARLGLDWTHLSLTYNPIDLSNLAEIDEADGYEVDGTSFFAASASSKIGPVFSISPIGKLVVDVRAQLAFICFVNATDYYAYKESTDEERYFSFSAVNGDEDESLALGDMLNYGFKTNYGITLRYGGLGVALDYFPGKVKSDYNSHDGAGEAKFKNNMVQFKLSLTL